MDKVWGVSYLANVHLLTLLAPAIRNQPPDRDVRIIAATCGSYMLAPPLAQHISGPDPGTGGFPKSKPWQATGTAKLALMSFLVRFNAQTRAYVRKDKEPVNARTFIIDPGLARTPTTRTFLTLGSLWGLLLYFLTYPLWWLVLKSPQQAGESFLFAAMSPEGAEGDGGVLYRECRRVGIKRDDVYDQELAKQLWEATEKEIEELEKNAAVERKKRKMDEEKKKQGGRIQEVVEVEQVEQVVTTASENLNKKKPSSSRKR